MKNDKIYRNEWKYICRSSKLEVLEQRLAAVLEKDIHSAPSGNYEIHSLYFDDYQDTCARENEAGLPKRFKYRIRYYGACPEQLRLEYKEKLYGRCRKESCVLPPELYQDLMEGRADEVFWKTEDPLLKRFCVDVMTRMFAPKAIVDYERTAYVEPIANVRITLDRNISVSADTAHFQDGEYRKFPLLPEGQHVLEAKFDYVLPQYLKKLIPDCSGLVQTAFSKYYMGRVRLQSLV